MENKKELNEIVVFCREDEEINVGDEVVTTTSDYNFNSLDGCFDNEAIKGIRVLAEHIGEDYSEFKSELSCNGGVYGYDYFKVVEIVEV